MSLKHAPHQPCVRPRDCFLILDMEKKRFRAPRLPFARFVLLTTSGHPLKISRIWPEITRSSKALLSFVLRFLFRFMPFTKFPRGSPFEKRESFFSFLFRIFLSFSRYERRREKDTSLVRMRTPPIALAPRHAPPLPYTVSKTSFSFRRCNKVSPCERFGRTVFQTHDEFCLVSPAISTLCWKIPQS
jgi:hypothetical protein